MTTSGTFNFDSAAATAGKRGARSSSFLLHMAIRPSTIAQTARKPSYFSSYAQLSPAGGVSVSVASMGGKTLRRSDSGVGLFVAIVTKRTHCARRARRERLRAEE